MQSILFPHGNKFTTRPSLPLSVVSLGVASGSALGISIPYATDIRRGRRRPYPRHWETLATLVGVSLSSPDDIDGPPGIPSKTARSSGGVILELLRLRAILCTRGVLSLLGPSFDSWFLRARRLRRARLAGLSKVVGVATVDPTRAWKAPCCGSG